jgi:CheY-like chemotaxis protein
VLALGLARLGYEVRTALDGLHALEIAARFRPRIAIVDIALPLMTGWDLARRLHALALFRKPRLIAISGYGDVRHRAESLSAGFEVHLVKPVKLAQLGQLLAASAP